VTGALLVASLPDRARRGRMLTIGNLGFPLMLLLFAASRSFVLSLVLMLLTASALCGKMRWLTRCSRCQRQTSCAAA